MSSPKRRLAKKLLLAKDPFLNEMLGYKLIPDELSKAMTDMPNEKLVEMTLHVGDEEPLKVDEELLEELLEEQHEEKPAVKKPRAKVVKKVATKK